MPEQCQPGLHAMDEAERPGGSPGRSQRAGHDLGGQVGGDRMTLVRFHHDWAPRGQRRRGVPARDGECEREVRCREHGHGPDRAVDPAQVGRDSLSRGDHRVGVLPVPQHRREHPQLPAGAGHLAGEPLAAQGGLGVGDRRELARAGVERVGHRLERGRPASRGSVRTPGRERGHRGRDDRVDVGVRGVGDRLPDRLAGTRVKPLNHLHSFADPTVTLSTVTLRGHYGDTYRGTLPGIGVGIAAAPGQEAEVAALVGLGDVLAEQGTVAAFELRRRRLPRLVTLGQSPFGNIQ